MDIITKTWHNRNILRSIFSTIYFNLHYLPFQQAIKLPILLHKPKFHKLKGSVTIDANQISFGMVRLGFHQVSLYPNTGITLEIHEEGKITFHGRCAIGNASAISIGNKGHVVFGNRFNASASLKLTSYCYIEFREKVRIGWENTFMDTDFHKLTKISGGYSKGFGSITIGSNNWFGLRCTILKNTQTPDFCVIGGCSVLNRDYRDIPEYSVISGNPAQLKRIGLFRDMNNDQINYLSE